MHLAFAVAAKKGNLYAVFKFSPICGSTDSPSTPNNDGFLHCGAPHNLLLFALYRSRQLVSTLTLFLWKMFTCKQVNCAAAHGLLFVI